MFVTYQFPSGKALDEIPGDLQGDKGEVVVQSGMDDFNWEDVLGKPTSHAPGSIEWGSSYFGSVRAIAYGASPRDTRTVLWIGLNFKAPLPSPGSQTSPAIASAGANLGFIKEELKQDKDILIYDAASRRLVTRVPLEDRSYDVHYLPSSHRMAIETSQDSLSIVPLP
jgi:hypothetical protein